MITINNFPKTQDSAIIKNAMELLSSSYEASLDNNALNEFAKNWLTHKYNHTINVANFMKDLIVNEPAISLSFDKRNTEVAMASALTHDVGRFLQIQNGEKIHDSQFNHADVSIDLIKGYIPLAKSYTKEDVNKLVFAVSSHSDQEINYEKHNYTILNSEDKEKADQIAKLLRDADKLDNIKYFTLNKNGPDLFLEGIPQGTISEGIKEQLEDNKTLSPSIIRTQSDAIVYGLSWIFDVNFNTSKNIIKEIGFVERGLHELDARGVAKADIENLKSLFTPPLNLKNNTKFVNNSSILNNLLKGGKEM